MLKYVRVLGVIPGIIMLWWLRENQVYLNQGVLLIYIFGMEIMEKVANYIGYRVKGGRVLETFKWKSFFKGAMPILLFLSLWLLAITINQGFGQIGAASLLGVLLITLLFNLQKGRLCERGLYVKGMYCDYSDIEVDELEEGQLQIAMKVALMGNIKVNVVGDLDKLERLKEKIENR